MSMSMKEQFLPSIAQLARAQRYHNEGLEVLLPVPFDWVHVPALYFNHEIYHWIFCVMVADRQALAADLGHSGLHEVDSDDSLVSHSCSKPEEPDQPKK